MAGLVQGSQLALAGARGPHAADARVVRLVEHHVVEAEYVRQVRVDDSAVAHHRHHTTRVGADHALDRLDHDAPEREAVDFTVLTPATLDHVEPSRVARRSQFLDRNVEVRVAVELGQFVVDDYLEAVCGRQRRRSLHRAPQRTAVHRVDALARQPRRQRGCLAVSLVSQLRISGLARVLDTDGQGVPDEEQVHGGPTVHGQAVPSRTVPAPAPRILVVDHDDSVREMLGALFRDEGFEVAEAADGEAALAALRAHAPDCVLVDLVLPDIDGIEVLKVRADDALAPDTRVVVLTARTDAHDADACREFGADAVLYKPVDPEQLWAAVRAALARTPASP